MADKTLEPLTFGFDIGIASVGWCVLGENRIVDLGVRCFDKAETDVKGESLNLARRTARLTRRRLRRRAWRLTKLARLLKRERLISDTNTLRTASPKSPWCLRLAALDSKLDTDEWARVIYHLCKHRGFHWISKAEEKKAEGDAKGDNGKVKKADTDLKQRMASNNYRSAAEMMLTEFPGKQRNKQDDYSHSLSRILLGDELALLFRRQRELGNPHAGTDLEAKILGDGDRKSGLFWEQKPPLAGADLLKMLGRCTFERNSGPDGKGEYRAPKASFTAERHVWLTKLLNLKIVVDGVTRRLAPEELKAVLTRPYENKPHKDKTNPLTYKQFHKTLVEKCSLPESFVFAGLTGKKDKDPLAQTLITLTGWQDIWRVLKEAGLEAEWLKMSTAALEGQPEHLDEIARVLSVFKDDNIIRAELNKLNLPGSSRMTDALLAISFDKFSNLSLKALRRIVPLMETGLRYDEAVAAIPEYGHHSQLHKPDDGKELYLPALYEHARGHKPGEEGKMIFSERVEREITGGIPRNPVVLRAINQARKVMNALLHEYIHRKKVQGKYQLVSVHVELARDLSRPLQERKAIKDAQDEYQERNENDRALFIEQFHRAPKDNEFEKFQLYREQHGKSIYPEMSEDQRICAYSFAPIDLGRLLEDGYVEIDHALPYRRSYDNSKNNKVLVLKKQNQDKGNRTPYEYLNGAADSPRWRQFVAFVEGSHAYREAKKNRLLRKNFGEDEAREFRERNLTDTRYICRFFKNYVERYLEMAGKVGAGGTATHAAKRCVVVSGGLTSLLRAKWGLPTGKEKREENDRHHAMDAAVVAACGHLVVQRTSTMLNTKGWAHRPDLGGYLNVETGEILTAQNFVRKDEVYKLLPRPWKHFRDELLARLNIDDASELRIKMESLGTYPAEALDTLRPLFVSRAPQRRNGGALHKETIYGENRNEFGAQATAINRKAVADLKESDFDKIVGAHEPRNEGLIKSLRQWLQSQKALHELVSSLGKGKSKREPTEEEKRRIEELGQLPRKPLKSDSVNGPFTGPIIKKVKLVETRKSGVYVRNGVADLGQVVRTKLYRHGDEFLFLPRYELPDNNLFGLPSIPADAVDTGVELYGNDAVRIEHPNLSHCYRAIRTYRDDETGEKLIDVVAAFPSGVFLGYWAYFEPSNNRPVVQLHDSARFFLLEANKATEQHNFTLIAKKKKGKDKDEGDDAYEYLEKSPPLERKPFKYSLEENIKRQIGTAKSFEKLHVDILGNVYPAPPELRRGMA